MVERAPNTQYILSLSYGKDSLAAIEACIRLGYPIDRIVHAEVWATDTIPADLPPMVAFKDKADRIIKERYGLDVEHVCATRPVTLSSCRERERERAGKLFQRRTYEERFYAPYCHTSAKLHFSGAPNAIYGWPSRGKLWCNSQLKIAAINRARKVDLREAVLPCTETEESCKDCGGSAILGFPMLKGNWCTSDLKNAALRAGNYQWVPFCHQTVRWGTQNRCNPEFADSLISSGVGAKNSNCLFNTAP